MKDAFKAILQSAREVLRKVVLWLKKSMINTFRLLSHFWSNRIVSAYNQKKDQLYDHHRCTVENKEMFIDFQVREAFNKLRINLDALSSKREKKCILISSPIRSEGKTTICVHMARSLAQFGKRTLLIDCNLRTPRIGHIFGIDPKTPGLSNILSTRYEWHQYISSTDRKNLYVICAGYPVTDPVRLLGSRSMGRMIEIMLEEFDFVLLDTPSILLVPDTIALSKHGANVYLVIRHHYTKQHDILKASNALHLVNRPVKGIIYNDMPITKLDYNLSYLTNKNNN